MKKYSILLHWLFGASHICRFFGWYGNGFMLWKASISFKNLKLLWPLFVVNDYQYDFYMQDMAKLTHHFVRGNNPKKFASTLVSFLGKVSLLTFLFLVIWLNFPKLCGGILKHFDLTFLLKFGSTLGMILFMLYYWVVLKLNWRR